jgi:hypothetical protein
MPGKNLSSSHWDHCPRFETDWVRIFPDFPHLCISNLCHTHENECIIESHRKARLKITKKTKEIKIQSILNSIPIDMKTQIIEKWNALK